MVAKYIAVKEGNEIHDIIESLERLGIKYDYYGHDKVWSVLKIHGFNSVSTAQRTYEMALKIVGVDES